MSEWTSNMKQSGRDMPLVPVYYNINQAECGDKAFIFYAWITRGQRRTVHHNWYPPCFGNFLVIQGRLEEENKCFHAVKGQIIILGDIKERQLQQSISFLVGLGNLKMAIGWRFRSYNYLNQ